MPVPGWLTLHNGLTSLYDDACGDPWFVYFETALVPAGHATITLLSFGMDDAIRGFFRPRGLRTRRHGRRGRKSGRRSRFRGFRLPELGETIGKNWPGYDEFSERHVTAGVKSMWLIDAEIQRILFWYMIIDVTETFYIEWTSNIHRAKQISCNENSRLTVTEDLDTNGGVLDWGAARLDTIEDQFGTITWNIFSGIIPEGDWQVYFGGTIKNLEDHSQVNRLVVAYGDSPDFPGADSGEITFAPSAEQGVIATATMRGPSVISTWWYTKEGFARGKDMMLVIRGAGGV